MSVAIPASRPQAKQEDILSRIKTFDRHESVILVGIRGYYKNSLGNPLTNDRGIYDDAIFVVSPTMFAAFNANTDPSVFRKGISSLKPGVHIYRRGNHGISKPGGGYPAFRPATLGEKLPVVRDQVGNSEGIAINIHKGSFNSTSSEGCQTIHPSQWAAFYALVDSQLKTYKQTKFPYILIEA